jgi:2-polyprenyl-3-methyl-5-hydroxy-6-metoxy-1,4-benzoquinol methylase
MKQTQIHYGFNPDLLALMPLDADRVIEVGCNGGGLGREYRKMNPRCDYVGIEIDTEYAKVACEHYNRIVVANIEQMSDSVFDTLFPSSCWIFGDVLEHLYDPWALLSRIRRSMLKGGEVLACIPNAQHWSVQARLNCGDFVYADVGLMDRTHIRWFTRKTIWQLFQSTGYEIIGGRARVFDEPYREAAMVGVRAFAEAIGTDVALAIEDATAFQWIIHAVAA